ncbi:MAG: peptidoglycan-associated lipoprotein [Betaproteobacteria bacterium HGW-Betaproteobacteria-12]|nr:MAG: peptidoglycan-associated lipoprotein [Betaproteobacteria bacterium HGW-Betaproteobacteria-12]
MIRPSLPAALLLSLLLAACASNRETSPGKHIAQSGALKVHPGLLGQPVPAELAPLPATAPAAAQPTQPAASEAAIRMDQEGLRTQRSVYFDYNSADLKADYAPALRAHARYLAANPQARVRIEGNADERGSAGYNLRLGERRAATVRDALTTHGAAGTQVTIKSLGSSQPKLKGRDEQSWAENRRADVVYEIEK